MSTVRTKNGTELPIISLKGKQYLQVAHRLVWFREERPEWSIHTEIIHHDENKSLVKATIMNQEGRIISTSHKQENKQGFADHLEKSETGAIGRALALCGYGTQFTDDLEEGERLADSPLPKGNKPSPFSSNPVSAEERKSLTELAFSTGWTREWVLLELKKRYKVDSTTQLNREQFNEFRDMIANNPQKKEEEVK